MEYDDRWVYDDDDDDDDILPGNLLSEDEALAYLTEKIERYDGELDLLPFGTSTSEVLKRTILSVTRSEGYFMPESVCKSYKACDRLMDASKTVFTAYAFNATFGIDTPDDIDSKFNLAKLLADVSKSFGEDLGEKVVLRQRYRIEMEKAMGRAITVEEFDSAFPKAYAELKRRMYLKEKQESKKL